MYFAHISSTFAKRRSKDCPQPSFDMLIMCIKNITFFVEWFIAQRFCRVCAIFLVFYDCPIIRLRQTSFAFIRSINITRLVYLTAIDVCFSEDDSFNESSVFSSFMPKIHVFVDSINDTSNNPRRLFITT